VIDAKDEMIEIK
jgi:SRSO17 transposase